MVKSAVLSDPVSKSSPRPTSIDTDLMLRAAHRGSDHERPQLVVDVEDTLVGQKEDTLKVLNRRYGTNLTIEDVTSYLVQDAFRTKHGIVINRPEIIAIHRDLWQEGPKLLDPEIPTRLGRIGASYEIHLVTASVAPEGVITQHLQGQGIAYHSFRTVTSSSDKIRLFGNSYGCVEDSDSVVAEFAANGKVGIILDAPWNGAAKAGAHGDNVVVVRSWKEIEEFLLDGLTPRARE